MVAIKMTSRLSDRPAGVKMIVMAITASILLLAAVSFISGFGTNQGRRA